MGRVIYYAKKGKKIKKGISTEGGGDFEMQKLVGISLL